MTFPTDAGYRLYEDGTLARLAFVARAKQLGCSLQEITDLCCAFFSFAITVDSPVPASSSMWEHWAMESGHVSWLARLCWCLEARRWMLSVWNIAAAALFVVGCVGFYAPGLYVPSVTMFLGGSLLFLLSALGSALLEHGPSQ